MAKIFILLLVSCCFRGISQNVGIGTSSPTNKLHLVADANPLRIVGLQPGAESDSILSIDAGGVVKKRPAPAAGWFTSGNTNTNPAINFLGTIDSRALVIRTNNQSSAIIDPSQSARNNAFGNRTFGIAVTGSGNNAFGYQALSNLANGSNNTVMGDSAAFSITSGADNVAIGSRALLSSNASTGNTAVGSGALKNNLSSENNAIGKDAAAGNTTGSNVLAFGTAALQNNKTTSTQIAIGNNALQLITGGLENIAIGYNAGLSTTSSSYNVLLGHYALSSAATASNNTIIGHNAGLSYTAAGSTNNTFIGYQAALSQTGGEGNTYIGAGIDIAGNPVVSNSSGLGQGVQITASNQVRIGNSSVLSIGGQVGWTTFSDARIKKNVVENVPGLAFIERLRPVTYNYDMHSLQKIQGSATTISASGTAFESIRFTGLIAQEVEAAANSIGYNFSGVDKPSNEKTVYGLRYAEFVVPMIKAIQEMKQMIDAQQKEIEMLKAKIEK